MNAPKRKRRTYISIEADVTVDVDCTLEDIVSQLSDDERIELVGLCGASAPEGSASIAQAINSVIQLQHPSNNTREIVADLSVYAAKALKEELERINV